MPAPELLRYRQPYDWPAVLHWLEPRATPGVELVSSAAYRRTVRLAGHRGVVHVSHEPGVAALRVDLSLSLRPVQAQLETRLRHLFDLDTDPAIIQQHLGRDAGLRPLLEQRPGLRIVGAMEGFELAVRAVLGQQVSVRGASTLAGRLVALIGERLDGAESEPATLPLSAERLADAAESEVASIGIPRARARTLIALARAVAAGSLELFQGADPDRTRRALLEIPGIGEWTAEYVLMRAVRWPDAFPAADLGLRRAAGGVTAAALRERAEVWRPWRSYAAVYLWQSLSDGPR
jgi:AraC family transcriptional regulator of adaptative response / DNA-3-methyladenine glycosylase II